MNVVFVDLEKSFDRVPWEGVEWVLRKWWFVKVIMKLYDGSKLVLNDAENQEFILNVGVVIPRTGGETLIFIIIV